MHIKFLFVTDMHFRVTRPVSRLDNDFMATLLGKVEEIRKIATDERVAAVIIGGDIFDREDSPHSVVIRVNRAFKLFGMPVFTVIGNHDIYGYEGKTVDVSCIGSLFEMGSVKRLDLETFHFEDEEKTRMDKAVVIYGIHAFDKDEFMIPESEDISVIVAHKMITDIPLPDEAGCLMIDKLKTNARVLMSGDIHTGHSLDLNGTLFVNPGSMTRKSIEDRERQPQVAVITISEDGEVSSEFKSLSTRPPEVVFDLKAYSNRMASKLHTDEFVRTYAHAVVSVKSESNKMGHTLIEFLEANGVADKIQESIKGYLVRAQKEELQEIRE